MEDDTFDYQAYVTKTPPDPATIRRGTADRRRRFDAAMMKLTVRIDEDVLNEFIHLTTEGQSCERLINQALREWLSAKDLKELVRTEIQRAVQESLSSGQPGGELPPS
jgi:uncharacterized protein (DUF4415 family)